MSSAQPFSQVRDLIVFGLKLGGFPLQFGFKLCHLGPEDFDFRSLSIEVKCDLIGHLRHPRWVRRRCHPILPGLVVVQFGVGRFRGKARHLIGELLLFDVQPVVAIDQGVVFGDHFERLCP